MLRRVGVALVVACVALVRGVGAGAGGDGHSGVGVVDDGDQWRGGVRH